MTEQCYHDSYGTCTNGLSDFCGKTCPGAEKCPRFVTEKDFFAGVMDGSIREDGRTAADKRADKARASAFLKVEKTKKQLKREAKLEAEKNRPENGGFTLGDDPAFKALFDKK